MKDKLQFILRVVWISVGCLFIGFVIFCGIQFNLICSDIRKITSQSTIEDMRQLLNIVENQQKIQLQEQSE